MLPFVVRLESDGILLLLGEVAKVLKISRILGNLSSLLDELDMLTQALFFGELFNILHQIVIRNVRERV